LHLSQSIHRFTGQVIGAAEAKAMGLVGEVMPRDLLLPRAWELARAVLRQPELNRRYTRTLLTEQLRRQINELLPYGLALEGLAITQ
jgi:enoyl-CoA hydratase/carnithine racemase